MTVECAIGLIVGGAVQVAVVTVTYRRGARGTAEHGVQLNKGSQK